jgi:hypothetical protein
MKRFKDILREFRENTPPDRGGNDDPHEEVKDFMKRTPFTHVTTGEDTIHFHSALDAANIVADKRADHEFGLKHAYDNRDERMMEYFGASTGTHDDVIDSIQDYIQNHPKLPERLRPHVASTLLHIEGRSRSRADLSNMLGAQVNPLDKSANPIGKSVHKRHSPSEDSARHPHLSNDTYHLGDVINIIKGDPDYGYFLQKEEYK